MATDFGGIFWILSLTLNIHWVFGKDPSLRLFFLSRKTKFWFGFFFVWIKLNRNKKKRETISLTSNEQLFCKKILFFNFKFFFSLALIMIFERKFCFLLIFLETKSQEDSLLLSLDEMENENIDGYFIDTR